MSLKKNAIILLILILGIGGAYALIKSAPKPQKKAVEAFTPLVEVSALEAGSYRPSWQTGGNVNAKPSVKLMAQVTGQVTSTNPQALPGAFLQKGDLLGQIDDSQYQLIVQQKQAAVVQAQADLDVEYGQQKNAENNYKLSGLKLNKTAKSLALREPQLAAAKAALSIAQAELAKAKLDLDRTRLRMPFDGHVMSMNLTQGSFVAAGTQVFEVVDSSEFWLQVKVPQSFVSILDAQHAVTISKSDQWGEQTRQGKIKQVLPSVDESDRQVRVLIAIEAPLHESYKQTPVRYNDYVSVTLFGRALDNVYALSSDAINDANQLWVVDKNDQLQLRNIHVVYKGRRQVWANVDAQPGDQKLESSLQVAAVNMPVRVLPKANRAADEASL
ncbi:MAG: efflux RND transporter periplasmic adaptor subunit [Gammaproteobacteria bacterium]|nr:efflux RND transporter periplasmic adaptor subunit [Gammaproteobacteria bacterium]